MYFFYRFDSLKLNQQQKIFNQSINVLNKVLKFAMNKFETYL